MLIGLYRELKKVENESEQRELQKKFTKDMVYATKEAQREKEEENCLGKEVEELILGDQDGITLPQS